MQQLLISTDVRTRNSNVQIASELIILNRTLYLKRPAGGSALLFVSFQSSLLIPMTRPFSTAFENAYRAMGTHELPFYGKSLSQSSIAKLRKSLLETWSRMARIATPLMLFSSMSRCFLRYHTSTSFGFRHWLQPPWHRLSRTCA